MNSQILIKINNFIKNRLIEFLGIFIALISISLLASIISYSPSDPNFIYTPENVEIKNIGGFYGSVVSDFLLQSLGLISILLTFTLFYWGIKITTHKAINNILTKIFFILLYIGFGTTVLNVFYNDSFWLIDNGNGGFVGRSIKENIYYLTPLIENQYVVYGLILLTFIFFILILGIKKNEITKILLFPFVLLKKIKDLFKGNKKNEGIYTETPNVQSELENYEEKSSIKKQPFLPFSKQKEVKNINNNFKLPTINFLEKNPDSKNKKSMDNFEVTKNSEFLKRSSKVCVIIM